ncbi:MAG: RNA polymerase sigma factor [Thermoanaerobaculia bacterium]
MSIPGEMALAAPTETRDDMAFWRTAYEAHAPAVLAYVLRRIGRRDEAEDLLHETFVRAIRAGSLGPDANLRGYLLRIAHNLWVNRLRRPRLVVPAPAEDGEPDALDEAAGGSPSPEDAAEWSGFRRGLARVLAGMPRAHRRAFELAVLQGLPYAEVAERTGWTLPQVKINVFRARRRILEELGDQIPGRPRSTES